MQIEEDSAVLECSTHLRRMQHKAELLSRYVSQRIKSRVVSLIGDDTPVWVPRTPPLLENVAMRFVEPLPYWREMSRALCLKGSPGEVIEWRIHIAAEVDRIKDDIAVCLSHGLAHKCERHMRLLYADLLSVERVFPARFLYYPLAHTD